MFAEERQKAIAETIRQKGKITISEITETYGISDESARRDLRVLEAAGLCRRTHGGAIVLTQVSVRPPADRSYDAMPIYPDYDAIAKAAATYIRENDIVYLTGGSFGFLILRYLPKDIHYTLVVNNVDVAQKLRPFANIDVYLAGGKMRQSGSLVDTMAADFVRRLHFDLCLLTGAGLTATFGLSNGTDETAAFQRIILQNSRKKLLLLPASKIGTDSFIQVCPAKAFDTLITDWECLDEHRSALTEAGVEVVVVPNPETTR